MSAVVAVAIHLASELSPDLAARTLKSCLAALGAERCRLSDEPPPRDDDAYYATVTSPDGDAAVHIRIVRRAADALPVAERDLAFAPEDAPGDRWASVGVVIAALVTAAQGTSPPPVVVPPPAPRRPISVPPTPPPRREHPIRVDLLVRLARETATNYPAELGGVLRGAFAPAGGPFFVGIGVGYAGRLGRQPDLTIPSGSVGAGYRWGTPEARWGAEVHVDALAERWLLSASEPGRTDSQGVWRFGGALGLDGTWGFTPRVQAVAGLAAQVLTPRVAVDVRGQNSERVPPVGALLELGLRYVP
ncbi:MAG TPA: hypothetical protein VH062_31880 [Polyangiaceae bacterium]|jgi:hypothetical protein|nr:hypothetical protein [Polyangiaceae bacterium]